MHHFLQILQPLFDRYGYLAVFTMIFLEDFGVPMPGETTLVVGSLLASHGGLNIVAFAIVAWAAAVLGDNVGYAIGRYAARTLILAIGRYLFITERRVAAVEEAFRRRGPALVVVARFVEILRQMNGIVAGMVRMPWRRFLGFNALGAGLWVAFWATLAYEVGRRSGNFGTILRQVDFLFLALFLLTVASLFGSRLIVRRRGGKRDEGSLVPREPAAAQLEKKP